MTGGYVAMKIFHVTFRSSGGTNRPKAKLNSQVLRAAMLVTMVRVSTDQLPRRHPKPWVKG